jgi:hypothetical protein
MLWVLGVGCWALGVELCVRRSVDRLDLTFGRAFVEDANGADNFLCSRVLGTVYIRIMTNAVLYLPPIFEYSVISVPCFALPSDVLGGHTLVALTC